MQRKSLAVALAVGSCLLASAAMAAGTLALGLTDDFANDGVSVGVSWNFDTRAEADSQAVSQCRAFEEAGEAARSQCRVAATIDNQCVAVAVDPEPGTFGLGWAMGGTSQQAEAGALAKCRSASAADRAKFCSIIESRCDTTG